MDGQATIKMYGNLELPQGTLDRPLVTFALFSYNQENYIREAVQGALAQTYSPLEIILSDDYSSDKTAKLIQEMAAAYTGPHRVIVRIGRENLGTYNHVISVASMASGDLFVVNAGDDVSYEIRTSELVRSFLDSGSVALGSGYDVVSEDGSILLKDARFPPSKGAQIVFGRSARARKENGIVRTVPGFSAAYRTDFLQSLSYSKGKLLIEDGTLNGIMNCRGDLMSNVDKTLIKYRVHSKSLTVRDEFGGMQALRLRERRISVMSESILMMMDQIELECARAGIDIEHSVRKGIRRAKRYACITSGYWMRSLPGRALLIMRCRSKEDFMFCMSRSFGFGVFFCVKKTADFVRRLPRLAVPREV